MAQNNIRQCVRIYTTIADALSIDTMYRLVVWLLINATHVHAGLHSHCQFYTVIVSFTQHTRWQSQTCISQYVVTQSLSWEYPQWSRPIYLSCNRPQPKSMKEPVLLKVVYTCESSLSQLRLLLSTNFFIVQLTIFTHYHHLSKFCT